MVGSARVAVGDGGHAEIRQWRHPLLEDVIYGGVSLGIDTANFSRSIVHIEIRRDKFLLGFQREWPRRLPQKFRQLHLVRSGGEREASKMLSCVSLAAEEPLLFARPKGNADRPPWLHLQCVENAHHLHGNHRTGPVSRSAGTRNPAIQVSAYHHHLIL